MAEGGHRPYSFKDSFSKASGDADEVFCSPCRSDGEWVVGRGYCPICEEYLCDTCLGVHRKQKMTRAHAILDKDQMPSGKDSTISQDLCVDVCQIHHPEIIRYFCKSHDKPGCGDCMTLIHTTCQKDRVQDISNGFKYTTEFQDINQQLQQLHQEIAEMGEELDNNMKDLDITYNQVLQKIVSVRKQVTTYLDQTEKKVRDKAAKMKKEDETLLNSLQAENQLMKTEIKNILKTIHDSNANMNSLFITTKQAKHRLVAMEKEVNKIQQSQQQQLQYEFLISNEIAKIVSAKTPLGKLSRKSTQKLRILTKKREQTRPTRRPTIDSTATYNRSINVKVKRDKKDCWIHDCTLLSADRLVVTDRNNSKVKLINLSNNTVISLYSTSSTPDSVTSLSTSMFAVTLPNECKIQVLNVTSSFTLQREIKVDKGCMGIAYKDGKFAVSYVYPGRVDILDIQGNVIHTIQPKGDILQAPYYITFGHDNDTVIVSDYSTKKVSTITFSGQVLRTYTHDTLINPDGVVITADEVLFVCSRHGCCIHIVSPDFNTSKIIINNDNHVVIPHSITYSGISHTLYISNTITFGGRDQNNHIQVYDLNV